MVASNRQTILIVDDDAQIRKLLGTLLGRAGYRTVPASNGRKAIEILMQHPVDLMITDLIMPEKEGIETIAESKRLMPEIKIIAISGGGKLSPQTYLSVAKDLGAVATMTKPIDTAKLVATVKALLGDPQ